MFRDALCAEGAFVDVHQTNTIGKGVRGQLRFDGQATEQQRPIE